MATFTLQDYDIPVALPDGLSEEKLLAFHPFTVSSPLQEDTNGAQQS